MILTPKDPSVIKDYAIDWANVLTSESETTINTSTWSTSSPPGLTVAGVPAPSISGSKTICWVTGGSAGEQYTLTNTIVTAGGRTHQLSIVIPCQDR